MKCYAALHSPASHVAVVEVCDMQPTNGTPRVLGAFSGFGRRFAAVLLPSRVQVSPTCG